MKVRVLVETSGSPWRLGEVIDLPDGEAQQLLASERVEPLRPPKDKGKV